MVSLCAAPARARRRAQLSGADPKEALPMAPVVTPQDAAGVSPSLKYRMVVFFSSVSLNSIS